MEELGYRPDITAQRMRGQNSQILGIHTYGDLFPISAGNYNHEYLLGIQLAAEEAGYDMLLFTSTIRRSRYVPTAYLGSQNRLAACDGAVMLGYREDHEDLARLAEEGFPFVRIGRRELPQSRCGWVDADFTTATADLVGRLIQAGYADLVYVAGAHTSSEPWLDRRAGVDEAVRRGVVHEDELPHVAVGRHEITPQWLEQQLTRGSRTFVAEQHHIATRLSHAANDLGATTDIAIAVLQAPLSDPVERNYVGYLMEPRLEVGRTAAALLIEILSGDTPNERGLLIPAEAYVPRHVLHPGRRHRTHDPQR